MSFEVFLRKRDINYILEKLNGDFASLRIPDDVVVLFKDVSPRSTTISNIVRDVQAHAYIYESYSSSKNIRGLERIQLVLPTKQAIDYERELGKDTYTMLKKKRNQSKGIRRAILDRILDRFVVLSPEDFPMTEEHLLEIIKYYKMYYTLYD